MFPRSLIPAPSVSAQNIPGLEIIWLETEFGKVESWLLSPASATPSQPAPAVIFAHGNGELIDYWPAELKAFIQLGMALLLVEYPGYGRSAGAPSQKSIMEKIKFLIENEDSKKPLSDAKIVNLLKARGIKIARRTVSKYREILKILPSHLRRQK